MIFFVVDTEVCGYRIWSMLLAVNLHQCKYGSNFEFSIEIVGTCMYHLKDPIYIFGYGIEFVGTFESCNVRLKVFL